MIGFSLPPGMEQDLENKWPKKGMSPLQAMMFLFKDIFKEFPILYPMYLILLVIATCIETLALASLAPLLASIGVGGGSQGVVGQFIDWLFDLLGLSVSTGILVSLVLGLLFIGQLLNLLHSHLAAKLNSDYAAIWQIRQVRYILSAGWRFHVEGRGSDTVNALVNEVNRISGAFYHLTMLVAAVMMVVVFLVGAVIVSWPAALIVIASGIVVVGITRPLVRRAQVLGDEMSSSFAELQASTSEVLSAAKLIKVTASEEFAQDRIERAVENFRRLVYISALDGQLVRIIFEFSGIVMAVIILFFGVFSLSLDASSVIVVLALFMRLFPRVSVLQQSSQAFNVVYPALQVVGEVLSRAEKFKEIGVRDGDLPLLPGPVAVRFVDLNVNVGETRLLRNVSLKIEAGSVVGIVGGSGAGKTTLIDSIVRLIEPGYGQVFINNFDVRELPISAWRRSVAYMGQDVFLFNASILDNIRWFARGASKDQVVEVARQAAISDFIEALPSGYDTVVGDRGVRLSGGERQRLGLARMLLSKPSLVLLDEATSALDGITEQLVLDNILALRNQATIVIVTHRLATLRSVDKIHFLEDGGIVEFGSWDELMVTNSRFRRYLMSQRSNQS